MQNHWRGSWSARPQVGVIRVSLFGKARCDNCSATPTPEQRSELEKSKARTPFHRAYRPASTLGQLAAEESSASKVERSAESSLHRRLKRSQRIRRQTRPRRLLNCRGGRPLSHWSVRWSVRMVIFLVCPLYLNEEKQLTTPEQHRAHFQKSILQWLFWG